MELQSENNLNLSDKDKLIQQAILQYKESNKIDIIKITNTAGVSVNIDTNNYSAMNNASAYIEWSDNQASIYVRGDESKLRQRFSIAHELAHFVLHKELLKSNESIDRNGVNSLDLELEEQADQLASEILMPQQIIENLLTDDEKTSLRVTRNKIIDLADKLHVSVVAMIVRLRRLKYKIPYIDLY